MPGKGSGSASASKKSGGASKKHKEYGRLKISTIVEFSSDITVQASSGNKYNACGVAYSVKCWGERLNVECGVEKRRDLSYASGSESKFERERTRLPKQVRTAIAAREYCCYAPCSVLAVIATSEH